MFAQAYEVARGYTRPVVISTRFFDGTVECGCGAFIILNNQGWILTVAHLAGTLATFKAHQPEIAAYTRQPNAGSGGKVSPNPKWITNCSYWWGKDGVRVVEDYAWPEADLLVARLAPFDPQSVPVYPVIKDPNTLKLGTSLCKLGFPLHKIDATFDQGTSSFKLAPGSVPLPLFPLEGIFTRHVALGKSADGKHDLKMLETSSPGLRGQSGGPIFDVKGTVWAVQSRTTHFPLGFSPKVTVAGKEVVEHQFLNVGWGVHPDTLVSFLREKGISFQLSAY